jgi:hypothetical protein
VVFASSFYATTSGIRLDVTFVGTWGTAAVTLLSILPTFYDEIVYDDVTVTASATVVYKVYISHT